MAPSENPFIPPRVGRAQLTAQLRQQTTLSPRQSEAALRELVNLITMHLEAGTEVSLPGLGIFACPAGKHRQVTFRADRNLRQALREPITDEAFTNSGH